MVELEVGQWENMQWRKPIHEPLQLSNNRLKQNCIGVLHWTKNFDLKLRYIRWWCTGYCTLKRPNTVLAIRDQNSNFNGVPPYIASKGLPYELSHPFRNLGSWGISREQDDNFFRFHFVEAFKRMLLRKIIIVMSLMLQSRLWLAND